MRTPVEATGRRWKLAILTCFLGVAVGALVGMLGTGSPVFLWLGALAADGLLVVAVSAWTTSG